MDKARLVLDYLRVLIWPAVVIAIIFLFRAQVAALFGRITEASAFGATIKLEADARRAATASAALPDLAGAEPAGGRTGRKTASRAPRLTEDDSALGRVVREWNIVERLAQEFGAELDLSFRDASNVRRVVERLNRDGRISDDAVQLARELQDIRNRLVHGRSELRLTAEAADSLVQAISGLASALRVARARGEDA